MAQTHLEWLKTQPEWKSTRIVRDTQYLFQPFGQVVEEILRQISELGLPFAAFETFRSPARQAEVYEKGYSRIKTPGPHAFGLAIDIVGTANGKPLSGIFDSASWSHQKYPWRKLGEVVESYGLIWGGRWKSIVDYPHLQAIPVDLKLYRRILSGEWYPAADELTVSAIAAIEPPQIALYRTLYKDFIRFIPLPDRARYLRTLNLIRPYINEEWQPEPPR